MTITFDQTLSGADGNNAGGTTLRLIAVLGSLYAVKAGRTATDEEKCEGAEDSLEQLEEGDFVFNCVPPPRPPVASGTATKEGNW